MKFGKRLAGILMGLLLVPGIARAQQSASPAQTPAMTHLRVELVLAEYNSEKKISSLPYAIYVGVRDKEHPAGKESLRMGVNVPIVGDGGEHVGTDIDCWASAEEDGRYRIEGNVHRSSIYSADESSSGGGEQARLTAGGRPIVRNFDSGFDLVLRDGETGEGVSATDPFNGHVLRVTVTIHVVK